MRVLLTGGRAPATLDLARHLSAQGNQVFLAESIRFPISKWSNATQRTYHLPSPRFAHKDFTSALIRIILKERIDLLIPTCEEVFFIACHAQVLAKHTEIFCVRFDLLNKLHNKWTFNQSGSFGSVHKPKSKLLISKHDVQNTIKTFDQCVLKPAYSRFAVHTVFNPTLSNSSHVSPSQTYPWICQERIKGRELCTYSVARKGRLVAHACYHPKYRAGHASGFYFESCQASQIQQYVTEFVEHYNFTGQLGFDFIVDDTGRLFVLECNPRLTSGIHLFSLGSGFGEIFSREWSGETILSDSKSRMIVLAMLLLQFPRSILSKKNRELLHDFNQSKDVIFCKHDPMPALGQFIQLAENLITAFSKDVSPIEASTQDIEWDGEPLIGSIPPIGITN